MLQHIVKDEKKVEYLELIYDLIFVYVIGRNNSLLHHVSDGFVPGGLFYAYILCSLAVIQIWKFSTYYINMHGRNGLRDHVFLFINCSCCCAIGNRAAARHGASVSRRSGAGCFCCSEAGGDRMRNDEKRAGAAIAPAHLIRLMRSRFTR